MTTRHMHRNVRTGPKNERDVQGVGDDVQVRQRQQIIGNLENYGAEGVILGCTEIPLLISQKDVGIPVFDTTTIHAEMAVKWALE